MFLRLDGRQAEIAATTHFATQTLTQEMGLRPSESEVPEYVTRWKANRRPSFNEGEIAQSIRNLSMLRWLDVEPSAELNVPDDALLAV